jgi:hypothetical protein
VIVCDRAARAQHHAPAICERRHAVEEQAAAGADHRLVVEESGRTQPLGNIAEQRDEGVHRR